MIARRIPPEDDCQQILSLLERYAQEPCIRPVLADAQEVERLLELYSFRTPQLADRFCDQLSDRYRFEIYALRGEPSARRRTDSSYIRLQQLLSDLAHDAAARLSCEGKLRLSPTQLAQSDGLLLLAMKKAIGRG